MTFKTISELKEYYYERVREYRVKWDDKFIGMDITIGNKNVQIQVSEYDVDEKGEVNYRSKRTIKALNAKLIGTIDDVLLVKFTYAKGYSFQTIKEKEFRDVLSFLTDYWIAYKDNKRMEGILFDFTMVSNGIENDFFSLYYEEKNLGKYGLLLGNVHIPHNSTNGYFYGGNGQLSEMFIKKNQAISNIEKEITEIQKVNPTFISQNAPVEDIFSYKIERKHYYWQKEYFTLVPRGEELYFQGETMGEKKYPLEATSISKILEDVQEFHQLEVLFHPSIVNVKRLFSVLSPVQKSDSYLEDAIREIDSKLGMGETEKELFYVNEKLDNSVKRKNSYGYYRDSEYIKEFKTLAYEIYRVQTNKYYWFIFIPVKIGQEPILTFNENGEYPEEINEMVNQSMMYFFS